MLIANHRAGRLIEARGQGLVTYEEFLAFRSAFQGLMAVALKVAPQAIAIGDLRGMEELAPDVAPAVLGMLRADNVRMERSAHLVIAGSPFHRQYEQLVGATRNPTRHVFTEPRAVLEWLSPVLSAEDRARLVEMLG